MEEDEVVVADENGVFQVNPAVNYLLYGDPAVQPTTANANVPGSVMPRSRLNPPPRPRFISAPSVSMSISSSTAAANITRKSNTWKKAFVYIQADENHTVEKCQLHLPLSEETAGVDSIKTLLKEQVGTDVEILDSKFFLMVESEFTKGIC
ncbi:hypothetical protein AC249_AIPGENE10072 [Exaiptasia diaphana]|nr:hypothetical protein AC249_AIPGENE10072 [Exaiptasia diaphana]